MSDRKGILKTIAEAVNQEFPQSQQATQQLNSVGESLMKEVQDLVGEAMAYVEQGKELLSRCKNVGARVKQTIKNPNQEYLDASDVE